jgi:hypothetical protein
MAQEFGLQVFGVSGGIVQESTYNPAFIHETGIIQISGASGEIPYQHATLTNSVYMHVEGIENFEPYIVSGNFMFAVAMSYPRVVPLSRIQTPGIVHWENPPFVVRSFLKAADKAAIEELNSRIQSAIFNVRLMVNTVEY